MKELGQYITDIAEIKNRVDDLGLTGVLSRL
jgi:hypothetical protein